MTAAVPPPLPAAIAPMPPAEFSDRLSPILVKELRQGLRTRVFVSLFITIQVLMTLLVAISLTAASQDLNAAANSSGFFWFLIAIPVVFILPFRGFGTVGSEIKANTLDLILLTRLSARRIIIGKWLAILAQTALFVFAILPYAFLRYFLGGVNLIDDLIVLAWMLFTSAILTGITVGISPYQNRLTRVLFWVAILFLAQAAIPLLFMLGMGASSVLAGGGTAPGWSAPLAIFSFGILILLFMLETGAAKIAPEAENHAIGRRLISLVFLLFAALFTFLQTDTALPLSIAAFVIGLLSLIGAICEPVRLNAGLYRPFARRGPLGRLAGRFLTPGWPAATLFSLVYVTISGILLAANDAFQDNLAIALFLAAANALLLPAALTRLFLPRTRHALLIHIGIQTFCILAAIVVMILDNIFESTAATAVAILPTSGLLVALFQQMNLTDATPFVATYAILLAASTAILLLRSRPEWQKIAALEK
jgi:hypothetical protein